MYCYSQLCFIDEDLYQIQYLRKLCKKILYFMGRCQWIFLVCKQYYRKTSVMQLSLSLKTMPGSLDIIELIIGSSLLTQDLSVILVFI